MYTKNFFGILENPIYRERKTCSDILTFPAEKAPKDKIDDDHIPKKQ